LFMIVEGEKLGLSSVKTESWICVRLGSLTHWLTYSQRLTTKN